MEPLINNLILNFLFNLNNGAFTGPSIFPSILFWIKFLKLIASFSNLISLSPVKIKEINLFDGLGRKKVDNVQLGDLCAIIGLQDFQIGDTIQCITIGRRPVAAVKVATGGAKVQ